jgi:hypothetical protein
VARPYRLREPVQYGWWDELGDLWSEIAPAGVFGGIGVLQWRQPTAEEEAAGRERRMRIFANSRVPWIVSDYVGLAQFYDDAQDVVSFARWNKRAFFPKDLKQCLALKTAAGASPVRAYFGCVCPGLKSHGKKAGESMFFGWNALGGALAGLAGKLLPGLGGWAYLALAGQVSYNLFGVGLKLGPVMGAGMELFFRGLDAIGLPFGPEHNKYHQLRAARLLERAERGWNAGFHLGAGDLLLATAAIREAYGLGQVVVPRVFSAKDYPSWSDLYGRLGDDLMNGDFKDALDPFAFAADVYGTFPKLWDVASSMPRNALAYAMNDLLGGMMSSATDGLLGERVPGSGELTPEQRAMMAQAHVGRCPNGSECGDTAENQLLFAEWAASQNAHDRWERRKRKAPLDGFPALP